MYAPLFSCPLLSSKLDSSVIKILERHSLKLKTILFPMFWLEENLIWMKEVGNRIIDHLICDRLKELAYFEIRIFLQANKYCRNEEYVIFICTVFHNFIFGKKVKVWAKCNQWKPNTNFIITKRCFNVRG